MKCLVEETTKIERDIKYPFYAFNENRTIYDFYDEQHYYKFYLEEKEIKSFYLESRKVKYLNTLHIIKRFGGVEVEFEKCIVSSDVVNIPKYCYYADVTSLEDDKLANKIEEIIKDVKQSF